MQNEETRKQFDEIWQILRENAQEAEQRLQRMEQQREKDAQEAKQRFQRMEQQREKDAQEAKQRFQRTEQRLEKNAQEAEQRFQRTEQQREKDAQEARQRDRETDRKIQKLSDLFTNHWGRLIEALVEPGSIKLFQGRGINVTKSKPRHDRSRNGKHMEIDLLLKNKDDKVAVVIEVKTTPSPEDVHKFLDKFDTFRNFFPKYRGYTIYGAIAGIQIDESVTKFAYRRGLFVLALGNEGLVRMLNDPKFTPTSF